MATGRPPKLAFLRGGKIMRSAFFRIFPHFFPHFLPPDTVRSQKCLQKWGIPLQQGNFGVKISFVQYWGQHWRDWSTFPTKIPPGVLGPFSPHRPPVRDLAKFCPGPATFHGFRHFRTNGRNVDVYCIFMGAKLPSLFVYAQIRGVRALFQSISGQ